MGVSGQRLAAKSDGSQGLKMHLESTATREQERLVLEGGVGTKRSFKLGRSARMLRGGFKHEEVFGKVPYHRIGVCLTLASLWINTHGHGAKRRRSPSPKICSQQATDQGDQIHSDTRGLKTQEATGSV